MVLTASFALSLATGLSCHHRLADISVSGPLGPTSPSAKLDASVGASGPHDFSVRFSTVRYRRFHVHRTLPRVRDDREPPLCGTGRREYASDLAFRKTRIFFRNGLDRQTSKAQRTSLICASGNSMRHRLRESGGNERRYGPSHHSDCPEVTIAI